MGDNRSKSKTSRRAKRAKTNKRNNKRNNKRKQTFRKSRRVNRGGKVPQKRMLEDDGKYRDEKRMREDDAAQYMEDDASQDMEEDTTQPNSMEAKMRENKENNNYDPDREARIAHEKMKDAEIEEKIKISMGKGKYLNAEDPKYGEIVDQNEQLENTKRQNNFEVMMDWESDMPTFAGKKKRATRRK